MPLPSFLEYETIAEYKRHYERHYQRASIITCDGIRVYFKPQKFGHAFYQNSQGKAGAKDEFSKERARRMDWIRLTLEHRDALIYLGWNKDARCYEDCRRVSVVFEDFVVVVELSLNTKGELKGNFITCYVADRSIEKIRNAPMWDMAKCLKSLGK
ncbi:MAG: hypothetical protein KKF24_01010 [Gammaproteobacteria bacterium]|nr:hypothetical protein [Gammaproteobacteria bacterium]MBU1831250.1 hypothetical protein [Gammaproteobacteria bacterium]